MDPLKQNNLREIWMYGFPVFYFIKWNEMIEIALFNILLQEREAAKPKVEEVVEAEEEITHDENEWGNVFILHV